MFAPLAMLVLLTASQKGQATSIGRGQAEWRVELDVEDSEQARQDLEAYAEALTETNTHWAQRQRAVPCCAACAGVRYEEPRVRGCPSCQVIVGAAKVLQRKRGTCIHIAAMDAGIARARGEDACVRVVHEMDVGGEGIPYRYHAMVQRGGQVYDPSESIRTGERTCPYG